MWAALSVSTTTTTWKITNRKKLTKMNCREMKEKDDL
jgi:hypothetical protein